MLLFFYVLAVGIALPLPADPLLVMMGALAGNREYSLWTCWLIAIFAASIGDVLWYELGRSRGRSVLGFLCKLSLEPDTCVRKTEANFSKRGAGTLLLAKFIPGIGLMSVSLAGVSGIPYWSFLLADVAGCALWTGSYLLLGRIFHTQLDHVIALLGLFGRRAGLVVTALIALYIAVKYLERRRFLHKLRVNRMTPRQALDLIASGDPITIIDLRHPAEVERDGLKIAGALVLRTDELRARSQDIPPDRQIILYCT